MNYKVGVHVCLSTLGYCTNMEEVPKRIPSTYLHNYLGPNRAKQNKQYATVIKRDYKHVYVHITVLHYGQVRITALTARSFQ